MASSPITGERRPSVQEFRRSSSQFASIPQRSLTLHERAALDKADAAAEILYSHPSVRIFKFEPPTDAIKNSKEKVLPEADYPIDAIEVLPWRSHREQLASTGQMIIEKVQGSVMFLKAGPLINTILPRSQCWCVDGESKFVMRVGNFKYQRLEFPTQTEEDRRQVEEFKKIMPKILKYERTPCPFIRAFHVSLPEDAITPRRKGQWKRTGGMTPTTPDDDLEILKRNKTSRAWSFKATPPTSFPSRSFTYNEPERPRTASTPTNKTRFTFGRGPDSPFSYNSGDDGSESDKPDSESERHDSSHNSEADESDKEHHTAPVLKSPLKIVETLSPTVDDRIRGFEGLKPLPVQTLPIESESESKQVRLAKPSTPEPGPSLAPVVESIASPPAPSPSPPAQPESTIDDTELAVDKNNPILLEKVQIPEISRDEDEELHSDDGRVSPAPSALFIRLYDIVSSPPPEERRSSIDDLLPEIEPLNEPDQEEPTLMYEREEFPPTPPSPDAVDKVMASRIGLHAFKKLGYMDGLDESRLSTPSNRSVLRYVEDKVSEDGRTLPDTNGPSAADLDEDNMSIVSNDSFHTMVSEIPDVDEEVVQKLEIPTRPNHRRDVSDVTITAAMLNGQSSADNAPVDEATATSEDNEIRQRLRQRRRTLSPTPSSSNMVVPTQDQEPSLSKSLARTAATLAVIKPIEIVVFLVQILARIAQGATVNDLVSGELFRRPQPDARRAASRTVNVNTQRPTTPRGRMNERERTTNDSDEDDYGVPLLRKSSTIESPKLPAASKRRVSARDEDAVLD